MDQSIGRVKAHVSIAEKIKISSPRCRSGGRLFDMFAESTQHEAKEHDLPVVRQRRA
jgi:hypothetical protein